MELLILLFYVLSVINLGEHIYCTDFFTTQDFEEDVVFMDHDNIRVPRQLITGTVPSISTGVTCICVPPGTCSGGGNPTDGSGQIDIRIVTNPGGIATTPIPPGCNFGLVPCCYAGPYRCGLRFPPPPSAPATMAPGQSSYGAYPWQAAILTLGEVYLGSGVLIDNRHILTVAHKVYNVPINSFKVRLGEWDAASTTEPITPQDFTVARVFTHPAFNATNLFNDVALLRLFTTVNLGATSTIAAACLPTRSYEGSTCFVSGWGKNDFGPNGAYQPVQKQVDVLVKGAFQCQNELRQTRLGANFVFNSTSFICAGGDNGKDACTGDGGAPLVCQQIDGRWAVVGLVAWGIGCAARGVSGVYVNVLSYISWIFQAVNTL